MNRRPLPPGWRWTALSDICYPDRVAIAQNDPAYAATPYLGLKHIEPDTGRILVTQLEALYSESKSNNFRFTSEHVLYGKLRPYQNKVALPEFSGRCTTEMIPLKPVSVNRRWLAYCLRRQEVVNHATRMTTGSRMPRTKMQDFLALSVAVPPLHEQRRIVARIEDQIAIADRARGAANAQIADVAAMARALVNGHFPESPATRLPKGWRWAELGEVCDVQKGLTARQEWYAERGAWLVHYRDVTESGVNWLPGRHTFVDLAQETKLQELHPGTVLVGADAHDPATIGRKVALVEAIPTHVHPAYYAGEMLGVRPKADRPIAPVIVCHWLRSVAGYREIQLNVSGGHLNVRPARKIRIPIPPPNEQRRLVSALARQSSAIKRALAAAQNQLAAINSLSAASLQRAFEP